MSFRFVGTALSILGSSASGYYFAAGMPASAPHGPTVVVPSVHAEAPAAKAAGETWQPRIWVGSGAAFNPMTGQPLSREEQESGWVDGPRMAREPAPALMAMKPEDKTPPPPPAAAAAPPPVPAPAHPAPHARAPARGHAPAPPHAPAPAGAPEKSGAPEKAEGGYRIHLESYHDEHLVAGAWTALQKANPAVLGALQLSSVTVDIPKKGKFVRLLAGSFESKDAAEKACAALRKAHSGQYCHPVAPGRAAG